MNEQGVISPIFGRLANRQTLFPRPFRDRFTQYIAGIDKRSLIVDNISTVVSSAVQDSISGVLKRLLWMGKPPQ